MDMSIEADPHALHDLDRALRRVSVELEDSVFRRRLAIERARERWWGGHRRAFDDRCAELDRVTNRTVEQLAALRRTMRTMTDGAA
jgi:hypothetical protein